MKVTCFPNRQSAQGYVEDLDTIRQLIDSPVCVRAKEDAPLFSPTEFEGARRANDRARWVHLGALDFDTATRESRDALLMHLATLRIAFVYYTTFSHDPANDKYKFRIVVELKEPAPAAQWKDLYWQRLVDIVSPPQLGLVPDPQCKDAARIFFVPAYSDETRALFDKFYVPGAPVDLSVDLTDVPASLPPPGTSRDTRCYTRDDLHTLEKKLRRRSTGIALSASECLKHVRRGSEWGDVTDRNERLSNACYELIQEWPDLDADQVALMFAPSCELMQRQGGEAVKYTVKFVAQKLREKVKYVAQRKEQYKRENHEKYIEELNSRGFSEGAYTPDEIIELTRKEVHPHGWILPADSGYWVRTRKSGYVFYRKELIAQLAAHENLMPARPYGLTTIRYDREGSRKLLPLSEMVEMYGTIADTVEGSLVAQETRFYGATRSLILAECPMRKLTPTYSAPIDGWLKLLGGDRYLELCQWMAWATYLDRPCAMLVLSGATGVGKTLLANGLARLWTTSSPTSLMMALDSFNSGIASCPLVFADERIPRARDGRHRFDEMRELVSKNHFVLNEKHQMRRTVRGSVRIIVAVNSLSLMVGDTPESGDELNATLERIVHVSPDPTTAKYLDEVRHEGAQWGIDAIAEHALWLKEQHKLPETVPRFMFEQRDQDNLATAFVSASAMFGAICSWLIGFLREPRTLYQDLTSLHDPAWRVTVRNGHLYATPNALTAHWTVYEDRRPYHRAVRHAFNGLSEVRSTITTPSGVAHTEKVNLELFVRWCEDNTFAERAEIEELIQKYQDEGVYVRAEHAVKQRIAMRTDASNIAQLRTS